MNAQAHFWIVSDAVQYIRNHGDDASRRALQAFENAYGKGAPIGEIDRGKTALEYLAGFEAWHTDKFGDLSLMIGQGPWGGKGDITGMAGHLFTAFNHFVNPYPYEDHPWVVSGGYSYGESSKTGVDSFVIKGISDYLRARLDQENTLVFERIRSGWRLGGPEWNRNLGADLEELVFAPWTVLGPFYYDRLLFHHFEPLKVRGPNESIVGLQLLGPVFHAATDCCSVQHVRPALGYQHQVWENYVQSMVFLGKIGLKPDMVSRMLKDRPFSDPPRDSSGVRQGLLDIEGFLRRTSLATASMLSESMGSGWGEIWKMDDQAWKEYIAGPTIAEDTEQLYNQAIAATVALVESSFMDLEKLGVMGPDGAFRDGVKRPLLELEQDKFDQWPPTGQHGLDPQEQREDYLLRLAGDTEFDEKIRTELAYILEKIEGLAPAISSSGKRTTGARALNDALDDLERLLKELYTKRARLEGDSFCPVRLDEKIPIDSDMSAHFGTATYRLPSPEECERPDEMRNYMDQVEQRFYTAHLVQLTQAATALEFNKERFKVSDEEAEDLARSIMELRALRDHGLDPQVGIGRETSQEARETDRVDPEPILSTIFQRVTEFFSMPKLALATVVAAGLMLMVILPRGGPDLQFGVSSVDWEKPAFSIMGPRSKSAKRVLKAGPRPKLALVIMFEDVEQAKEQRVIDSYYRNLEPTPAMESRYRIIPPYELKEVVDKGLISLESKEAFRRGLKKELKASVALFAIVKGQGGDQYTVQSQLVNLESGKTIKSKEKNAVGFEAASKLRETATSLFEE